MAKTDIEIIKPLDYEKIGVKAILFDFDGTISTLREGWERIMEPLMIEMISGSSPASEDLVQEVKAYIDESTGIQTIFQMRWLVSKIREYGYSDIVHDEWWYKDEYNRRLMESVQERIDRLNNGDVGSKEFLIKGSKKLLDALKERGIELYIASGTDHKDVINEIEALGLSEYFLDAAGAPERRADCSKIKVMKDLIDEKGFSPGELVVIGDGKVEISLAVDMGATALGMATDEVKGFGLNLRKRDRLIDAGAHAIVADFSNYEDILKWLNIE
ncbi:MAG: HAD family hydrolase [Clostridiales bacterium]|nr:HAD family hydrolase [Clostridiales bacterium]